MYYICNYWKHYTQRNLFEILFNQTEIRLHLPLSDRFETKRTTVWFRAYMQLSMKLCILASLGIIYWAAIIERLHLKIPRTSRDPSLLENWCTFLCCMYTHREIFSKFYQIDPILDCIYHFLIDLEPDGRPFESKSIGKSI